MVIAPFTAEIVVASATIDTLFSDVVFGTDAEGEAHAVRWLLNKDIEVGPVKAAIREDLNTSSTAARSPGQGWSGTVNVNGKSINYSAYKLPDGTVNVGSIRPPR